MVRDVSASNHSNAYEEQSAMIFIENKYSRIYYNLISKAKSRILADDVLTEIHHVIPRSFYKTKKGWIDGNPDELSNLVTLTYREHYLAHLLLVRMETVEHWTIARSKMICALMRMSGGKSNQRKYQISSHAYEEARKLMHGRHVSESTRQKLSEKGKLHRHSDESKKKISQAHKNLKKFSEQQKQEMSETRSKNKWWNNGIEQCFCPIPPDNSYNRGRLKFNNVGSKIGNEVSRKKKWWFNGIVEVFSEEPPGLDFSRGRKPNIGSHYYRKLL